MIVLCGSLIDEGGDWDRRNRLKVYRGTYCMAVRDFKTAAKLFLDTVATFTSYELMDYPKFVTYTVFCSMIALSRPELREKVRYLVGKFYFIFQTTTTTTAMLLQLLLLLLLLVFLNEHIDFGAQQLGMRISKLNVKKIMVTGIQYVLK